jgi:hypothetical protein
MEGSRCKIVLIFSVIILFFGASVLPSISGDIEKIDNLSAKGASKNFSMNNDELLAYWSFNEGSGTIAHDYSGHGYDGLIYGAGWTTGYSGYALDFNGNSDYVSVDTYAQDLGFNKSDDYKISVWIKSTSTNSGMICQLSSDIFVFPIAYIRLNSDGTLEAKVQATEVCGVQVISIDSYNDGLWHYIEFIYHSGSDTTDPILELYIDQGFIGSDTDWLCPMNYDQFKKAKIGVKSYESTEYFDGVIDEINIYKKTNQPPNAPTIDGPTTGKVDENYNYTFVTTDPDGDDVKYIIDWGDGDSDTTNLNPSGTDVLVDHVWIEKGTYTITAKAEDEHFSVSSQTTLTITITKSKTASNTLFYSLLDRFPNLLPFLQKFL